MSDIAPESVKDTESSLLAALAENREITRTLVNRVMHFADRRASRPLEDGEAPFSSVTNPVRWAAVAQTDLQLGHMSLERAILAPHTF